MADLRRGSLDEIVVHFQELEDPRSTVNPRHPLASVAVIALLAVLAGAAGPNAIARWAALKEGKRSRPNVVLHRLRNVVTGHQAAWVLEAAGRSDGAGRPSRTAR